MRGAISVMLSSLSDALDKRCAALGADSQYATGGSGMKQPSSRCAAANNLLMQFQADILQTPVVRPQIIETTALGAAFLAGLAVGFWQSPDEVAAVWQAERTFFPQMSVSEAQYRGERWGNALDRSRAWEPRIS
jgi:glycerol kinase